MESKVILSKTEVEKLIVQYRTTHTNKEEILTKILDSNIALIKKIAYKEAKVKGKLDKYEDYIQEAIVQFMLCINNYDFKNGEASFSTYLYSSVSNYLKNYTLYMESSSINLRKKLYVSYYKIQSFEEKYFNENNKMPDINLISKAVNVEVEKIETYKKMFGDLLNTASLNESIYLKGEKKTEYINTIVDDISYSVEEEAELNILIKEIFESIDNDFDKEILSMYYFEGMSYAKISEKTGIGISTIGRKVRGIIKNIKLEMGVC